MPLVRYFEPHKPVSLGDPRYVDLDEVTGQNQILHQLAFEIASDVGDHAHVPRLFSGLPGSGKSSMLQQLQAYLDQLGADCTVVTIDVSERAQFPPFLTHGELVSIILLSLARRLSDDSTTWKTRFQGILDFLRIFKGDTTVVLDLGVVSIEQQLAVNGPLSEELRQVTGPDLARLVGKAKLAIDESIAELRKKTGRHEVVLVVDGLEKALLRGVRYAPKSEMPAMEAVSRDLYGRMANTALACHVILTIDPKLALFSPIPGYPTPHVLPMVKVRDRDRNEHRRGVELLVEVIVRRLATADLEQGARAPQGGYLKLLFSGPDDPSLAALARASGGYLRELMQLVREGIIRNRDQEAPISRATWLDVIRRHIRVVQGWFSPDDFATLQLVDRGESGDPGKYRDLNRLPETFREHAWDLVKVSALLGYQNGEPWFDLHPALLSDPRLTEDLSKLPGAATSQPTSGATET